MTKQIKYKNTGLEWCPRIPEHWELTKLKYIANTQGRIGFKGYAKEDIVSEGEGALTIGAKHIKDNKLNLDNPEYLSWEKYFESPEIFVKKGYILVVQRGSLGKVALIEEEIGDATINPSIIILKNIIIPPKFLLWILSSNIFLDFIAAVNATTTVPMITQEGLNNLVLLFPPLSEQQKIADYLDQKTTLIDSIIAKKEKQIELYKEERTAVINHAVTKGLNPDAKMKDSGIEWLGEIPEHWEIVKLKWISKIYSGGTPDKNKEEYWNGTIPWLNSGSVNQFIITQPSAFITVEGFNNSSTKWIKKGSVVIGLAGQGKTKGTAALVEIETTCNQSMGVIESDVSKILNKYLLYFLNTHYYNIRGLAGEGKRDGLNLVIIGDIKTHTPPLCEQQQIVSYLDQETQRIDTLIEKTTKQIDLLREYKEALINEVVTGQKIIN